jgi:hypothetical protein
VLAQERAQISNRPVVWLSASMNHEPHIIQRSSMVLRITPRSAMVLRVTPRSTRRTTNTEGQYLHGAVDQQLETLRAVCVVALFLKKPFNRQRSRAAKPNRCSRLLPIRRPIYYLVHVHVAGCAIAPVPEFLFLFLFLFLLPLLCFVSLCLSRRS